MKVRDFKDQLEEFRTELNSHSDLWLVSLDQPLPDFPVRNIPQLKEQMSSLARKLGRLRPFIDQFAPATIMQLPATGQRWDIFNSAVTNDLCLRKGPSLEQAVQQVDQILGRLDEMNQERDFEDPLLSGAKPTENTADLHAVFLGHGHNPLWSRVQLHLRDDLHLSVEVWESVSRAGRHNVEVLKGFLSSCRFAVLIVTGDDTGRDGVVRARQNVIHEIGLFQGRIGFEKVALLEQEGLEGFSNIDGLQRIPFQGIKIEQCFYELDRMLQREGFIK
jgi:hypothetical protein